METRAITIADKIDRCLTSASALGWQGDSASWEGKEDLYLFSMDCGMAKVEMAGMDDKALARLVMRRSSSEDDPYTVYSLFRFQTYLYTPRLSLVQYEGLHCIIDREISSVSYLLFCSGSNILENGFKSSVPGGFGGDLARPYESKEVIDRRGVGRLTAGLMRVTELTQEMCEKILMGLESSLRCGVLSPLVPEDCLPKEYFLPVSEWFERYAEKRYSGYSNDGIDEIRSN